MKSKHFWYISEWHVLDVIVILVNISCLQKTQQKSTMLHQKYINHLGDGVSIIELVGGRYEGVCEPHVGDGDQKPLVKIIRYSASVLNLEKYE